MPFAWFLSEAMTTLGEEFALDVQAEREPDLGFKTQWVGNFPSCSGRKKQG